MESEYVETHGQNELHGRINKEARDEECEVRGEGDVTMTFPGFEFPSDHRVMARYSFAIFPSFVFD